MKFSLADGVLQFSSAVFTVIHMNITDYNNTQEDVNFALYNVFNDLLLALQHSSEYYVEDIFDRKEEKIKIVIIVVAVALGLVVISLFVLVPAVGNVSRANMQVLSLFAYIPTVQVTNLATKCEKYIYKLCSNEHEDEGEQEV